jgi:hypothetical protein
MAAKTSAEWCDNNGISSIENRDLFDSCWSAAISSVEAQPPAPNSDYAAAQRVLIEWIHSIEGGACKASDFQNWLSLRLHAERHGARFVDVG